MAEWQEWHDLVVPESFDNDVIPFWNALKEHRFALYTCKRCGKGYWPMTLCTEHDDIGFDEMEWRTSSGAGSIFTYVIPNRFNNAVYAPDGPYVLMMVELDEGPLFPTRLVDPPSDRVSIGTRVEVDFTDVPATGMTLPLFRLAD